MMRNENRPYAFYFILILSMLSFLQTLLAVIYAGPRPFWTTDSIDAYACITTFGTPPPSVMPTACLGVAFVLTLIDRRGKVEEPQAMVKCKRICAGITSGIALVVTSMLVFATLVSGVCSID